MIKRDGYGSGDSASFHSRGDGYGHGNCDGFVSNDDFVGDGYGDDSGMFGKRIRDDFLGPYGHGFGHGINSNGGVGIGILQGGNGICDSEFDDSIVAILKEEEKP